mgnify:CR=1 FL=1
MERLHEFKQFLEKQIEKNNKEWSRILPIVSDNRKLCIFPGSYWGNFNLHQRAFSSCVSYFPFLIPEVIRHNCPYYKTHIGVLQIRGSLEFQASHSPDVKRVFLIVLQPGMNADDIYLKSFFHFSLKVNQSESAIISDEF